MKNVINYYYGIIIKEFRKRENNFIFYLNGNEFEFVEYYGDRNRLINIYSLLKSFRRDVDEIIINNRNDFITYYENKPYILLKKFNHSKKKIELDDVINYDCTIYVEEELNWKKLWISKLDYYEIQLEETGLKYPLLKQSFNYYLGLSEVALNLLNYVNYKNISYCVSHKRLEKIEDIFNPLNIIIDNKTRDIAECIKVRYFNDDITLEVVLGFIKKIPFTKDEIILLISRLIYPSYYFDLYEKIYSEKEGDKELNKIIKKNAEYEAFLKKIYANVKFLYNIPQIEFLEY